MALFDALLELSDAQVITDTDAQSTNVIDFQNSGLEMGAGEPLWLNVRVGTAFAGGTSIAFSLYSHTAATSIESGTALWSKTVLLAGIDAAGDWVVRMPLPYDVDVNRYVGLYYDVTGTMTAGTLNAWIDHGAQSSYDTQVTTSNI